MKAIKAFLALLILAAAGGHATAEDVTHCSVGGEAFRTGDVQRAIDSFTLCIETGELEPGTLSAAYSSRGNILLAVGATNYALEDLEQALALDADNVAALYGRGSARFELGEYPGALEDYNRALALEPDVPQLHLERANLYSAMGRYTEAVDDYSRVLAINPQDAHGADEPRVVLHADG